MSNGYTLTIQDELQLIEIVAQPEVSFEGLQASQAEMETIAQEQGINKVLIDASQIKQAPGMGELISFGKGLMGSPILKDMGFALVGISGGGMQFQFIKGMISNLGFKVDLFDDRDSAMTWLNGLA